MIFCVWDHLSGSIVSRVHPFNFDQPVVIHHLFTKTRSVNRKEWQTLFSQKREFKSDLRLVLFVLFRTFFPLFPKPLSD